MKRLPTLTRVLLNTKKEFDTTLINFWLIDVDKDDKLTLFPNYMDLDIKDTEAEYTQIGTFNNLPVYASDLIMFGNPFEISEEVERIIKTKILTEGESQWVFCNIDEKERTYDGMSDAIGMKIFYTYRAMLENPNNIVIIKQKIKKNGSKRDN